MNQVPRADAAPVVGQSRPKPPIASLHTEGRCFDTDWSIPNVAKLLRSNASRGMWRKAGATGGSMVAINKSYLRTVSARHRPSNVSLIFMQLEEENGWYLSLCFGGEGGYVPWNADIAEQWLWALFGEDRPRVRPDTESARESVRQFTLAMGPARTVPAPLP
jgi:hypothetical protein